jgi:CRISPR/Cas system-associated endonuclease Cas1
MQWGMPSLILDLQEIYIYIADDFVIGYAKNVKDRDFILTMDNCAGKKAKREFLNSAKRREFLDSFDAHFDAVVNFPRIRKGNRQKLETLIKEESLLLAQYLRSERRSWSPRIAGLS